MRFLSNSDALTPTVASRLRAAWSGGRFRSVRARRLLAAALVVAACAVAAASLRGPQSPPLIVAATDLKPGSVVTSEDVSAQPVPSDITPDHAITEYEKVIGRRLTGPVVRGEIITEGRLLTARLPESLTGIRGARLVPVRPADESVAHLIQQGDVVDVIDAERTVLARNAVVAVDPSNSSPKSAGSANPAILLAMDESSAQRVAAGSLDVALALILH